MSTKLYDGLKLRVPTLDLFELSKSVYTVIHKAFMKASISLVLEETASYHDAPTEDGDDAIFYHAEEEWKKRQKAFGHRHALNDPLRFSMCFAKTSEGNVLAYPYYVESAYKKALKSTKLFEDYGYWDNSDHPSKYSQKQWSAIGEEWDSALDADGTMSSWPMISLGKSNDPFREFFLADKRQRHTMQINRLVTPEARRKNLYLQSLHKAFREALTSDEIANENIFETFYKTRHFLQSEAGRAMLAQAELPRPFAKDFYTLKKSEIEPYEINVTLLLKMVNAMKT